MITIIDVNIQEIICNSVKAVFLCLLSITEYYFYLLFTRFFIRIIFLSILSDLFFTHNNRKIKEKILPEIFVGDQSVVSFL